MTQEEKFEEAKRLYGTANADQRYVLESLFPELRESEDEMIRKAMIDFFKHEREEGITVLHYGVNIERMIAWLEKQGQTFTKKDVDDAYLKGICDAKKELEKQGEQKPADKVEPKFKVGDVIRLKGSAAEYTIKRVTDTTYYTDGWSCSIERCEEDYELVEQKSVWSEEDEAKIVKLKSFIAQCNGFNKENRNKAFDLIDSIRPRHTWKPSETQLETLKELSHDVPTKRGVIEELLKQLKQL